VKGLVIKNTGSWYVVRTDDGQLFDCKVKGNFRLRGIRSTNPVAVGDRVSIVQQPTANSQQPMAFITDIEDRRNYIIRKASNLSKQSHIIAANVDQAALIVTVSHPETSTTFIDRFLASAEAYRVPVVLIFNKTDIYSEDDTRYLTALVTLYESLGYPCLCCSATTGEGIAEIYQTFVGKTTLLSGNSGVGKSTLLNRLIPDANVKTAEISAAHDTGMHTTTFSEMYTLPPIPDSQLSTFNSQLSTFNSYIIDTPGIKGFGTFDMERTEVAHYFREIFQTGQECRFGNCTHTTEPGCAVLLAVEEHRIAQSRYTSYLSMLEDKDADRYRK
jgi:ribosome biogenesis GTPase